MAKKYFFISIVLIGVLVALNSVKAAVSLEGFTFEQVVKTSQGREYYIDLIPGDSKQLTDGRYNLVSKLGFYGTTNPENDTYFTSDIYNKMVVQSKVAGSGQQYISSSAFFSVTKDTIPAGQKGGMLYDTMHSTAGGFPMDPGNYTVDALLNGKVVSTYNVCLPTFTSTSGKSIGNVTCGSAQPQNPQTPATPDPGQFRYGNRPIDVDCSPSYTGEKQCSFRKMILVDTAGEVSVYLNMYPVSDFDAGGAKKFSMEGHSYTGIIPAKTGSVAGITIPISELTAKMNAMQIADRNYYIEYQDAAKKENKSPKVKYDFKDVIPLTTSTPSETSNYTGDFRYDGTSPLEVICTQSTKKCTFSKQIIGETAGKVALYLNLYPKSSMDAGDDKGFSVNGYNYQVSVTPRSKYKASITVPISELIPKMNAMQATDRKYYVEFQDVTRPTNKSNKVMYDFENVIPLSAGQKTNAKFELASVTAPATTVTIKGTITADKGVSVTSPLDLYIWPSKNGTPQKIKSTDSLVIDSNGVSFVVTQPGLASNTEYSYRFMVASTDEIVYENSFSTNVSTDQATASTDAVCGSATKSPQASKPSGEAALCASGTAGTVTGTGPWNWTCTGTGEGADASCEASSLSNNEKDSGGNAGGNGDSGSGTGNEEASGKGSDTITTKSLLQNPFKTLDSFPKIIKAVVNNIVLPIAVPFIAVMLIYSGFLFVIARKEGNVYNIQKAKSTLIYTLIGAVLTLGSFVIANAIQGTVNSIVSTRYEVNHENRV